MPSLKTAFKLNYFLFRLKNYYPFFFLTKKLHYSFANCKITLSLGLPGTRKRIFLANKAFYEQNHDPTPTPPPKALLVCEKFLRRFLFNFFLNNNSNWINLSISDTFRISVALIIIFYSMPLWKCLFFTKNTTLILFLFFFPPPKVRWSLKCFQDEKKKVKLIFKKAFEKLRYFVFENAWFALFL